MADNNNKEYSAKEVMGLLQEISSAVSSGDYQNLTFGAPADVSSYDALAANSHAMIQNFTQRYAGEMIRAQQLKRRNAVSAAVGAGSQGAELMDMLSQFAPGMSEALLGHHGADAAMNSMLLNANGIASALGGPLGGITDPRRMHQNIRRAATQGALAINNAFNFDGTINQKFAHGLSLPQQAVVANSILSNKDQYESWSQKELEKTRRWQEQNPTGTTEDRINAGVLSETEISRFKNGTGFTAEAVRSFNDHIKNFQQEMNGFVASVSKITGSFDTAIDFIQDMTNGKAFSSGEQAKSLRNKAMQVASNMRIMAADAGVDSETMNNMYQGFGGLFERAQGKSSAESLMGDRAVTGNMAALATSMFLEWRKANPNATETEAQVAEASIKSRVAGFGKGDAAKDNIMLADLVRTGGITEEEARELAASGDQSKVQRRLKELYGANAYRMLRNNEGFMTNTSKKNSEFITELNKTSMNEGFGNEHILLNQRKTMRFGKRMVVDALSKALGRNVSREVDDMHREEMLSTDTLSQLGLSDEQIKEIQDKAASEHWSSATAQKYLVRTAKVDETDLNRISSEKLGSRLASTYGDSASWATKRFSEMMQDANPEVTDEDVKRQLAKEKTKGQRTRLSDLEQRFYEASNKGDQKAVDSVLSEMRSTAFEAVGDNGTYSYANKGFDEYLLESLATESKGEFENDQTALVNYRDLMQQGRDRELSGRGLMTFIGDSLSAQNKSASAAKIKDPNWRQKKYREFRQREAAATLFSNIADKSDLNDEQREQLKKQFLLDFTDTLRSDPSLLDKLDAQYANLGDEKDATMTRYLVETIGAKAANNSGDAGEAFKANFDLSSDRIRKWLVSDEAQKIVDREALTDFRQGVGVDLNAAARSTDLGAYSEADRKKARRAAEREKINADTSILSAAARNDIQTQGYAGAAVEGLERNTLAQTMDMDIQQAEAANKSFGQLSELDLAKLNAQLGVDAKMHSLQGMMSGSTAFENQEKAKKKGFDAKKIANVFESFLEKNGSLSEDEFREAIRKDGALKSLGLVKPLLNRRDDNEERISAKYAMGAYISAARTTNPDDVKGALERGYISQAIKRGDTSVSSDAVAVLRDIAKTLERIAPDVGSK